MIEVKSIKSLLLEEAETGYSLLWVQGGALVRTQSFNARLTISGPFLNDFLLLRPSHHHKLAYILSGSLGALSEVQLFHHVCHDSKCAWLICRPRTTSHEIITLVCGLCKLRLQMINTSS